MITDAHDEVRQRSKRSCGITHLHGDVRIALLEGFCGGNDETELRDRRFRRHKSWRAKRIDGTGAARRRRDGTTACKVVQSVCHLLARTEVEWIKRRNTALSAHLGITVPQWPRRLDLHVRPRLRVCRHRVEDVRPHRHTVVPRHRFNHQLKAGPARSLECHGAVTVRVYRRQDCSIWAR